MLSHALLAEFLRCENSIQNSSTLLQFDSANLHNSRSPKRWSSTSSTVANKVAHCLLFPSEHIFDQVICIFKYYSVLRFLKIMTITIFCGDISPSTWQRVWQHEALMATRSRPSIAPLLDIFPWLLNRPLSWLFCKGVHAASDTYYSDNDAYWQVLRRDVEAQLVCITFMIIHLLRKGGTLRIALKCLPQMGPDCTSSVYSRLLTSNSFSRCGFRSEESAHIIGTQLGSNLGVSQLINVCQSH